MTSINVDIEVLGMVAARVHHVRSEAQDHYRTALAASRSIDLQIRARAEIDQQVSGLVTRFREEARRAADQARFLSASRAKYVSTEDAVLTRSRDVYLERSTEDMKKSETEIKRRIKRLLERDEYSRETWAKASKEERKEILERLSSEIAKTMGIPGAKIQFYGGVGGTMGYKAQTAPGSTPPYRIALHTDLLAEGAFERALSGHYGPDHSYDESVAVLLHEYRHAYQTTALADRGGMPVDEATLDAWQASSGANYKTQERDGFDAYYSQSIEVDARAFSDSIVGEQDYGTFEGLGLM